MDKTTRTLARYTTSLKFNDLPAVTLHETKRRLIDAIACAMGGYGSEPAVIARKIASLHSGTPAARVLGSNVTSSMEKAADRKSTRLNSSH